MSDNDFAPANKHNTLMRGLYMLLMAVVFHVTVSVMFVIAVVQLILALLGGAPNARLSVFGRNLGIYLRQIADFLTFAAEELPFPFSDWPSGG